VKCGRTKCGKSVYPNQLILSKVGGVVFEICQECHREMEQMVKLHIGTMTTCSLTHGEQQQIKRERAAEYAGSDFEMRDA